MLKILFLCTGNSCRSQMAEALARSIYPQHHFYSAGIEQHGLNPYAVRVCEEIGLDLSTHYSKHLDSLQDISFNAVVTVCDHAKQTCPLFNGKAQKIHQSFEDPPKLTAEINDEEEILKVYRTVRDQIKAFLLNELPSRVKDWK